MNAKQPILKIVGEDENLPRCQEEPNETGCLNECGILEQEEGLRRNLNMNLNVNMNWKHSQRLTLVFTLVLQLVWSFWGAFRN